MSIFSQLTDKSWATQGVAGEINDRSRGPGPAAKTGLKFFCAVMTSVFFLFIIGYRLRMSAPDWVAITDPGILWLNTGLLIAASVVMQRARSQAEKGLIVGLRNSLTLAGLFTIGFLAGQYLAWQQLSDAGYYIQTSPAAAFFLLLTAIHALHLSGGLLVWVRAAWRAWRGMEVARLKLSVELCTTYWHYLLLVWFVFFALLLTT
jgi:cytochrome c oxidase subunit 3